MLTQIMSASQPAGLLSMSHGPNFFVAYLVSDFNLISDTFFREVFTTLTSSPFFVVGRLRVFNTVFKFSLGQIQ